MIYTYRMTCLAKALSPLTHNKGSEGNETLVNTEMIRCADGPRQVPVLSGNALRHRMVRQSGANWLVDELGLAGRMTLEGLNFMFAGGALTRGGATENIGRLQELWDLFPLYRILGGSLPDQIVPGTLTVLRGMLVCAENIEAIRSMLPVRTWMPEGKYPPASALLGRYQYTRVDAARSELSNAAHGIQRQNDSSQMIYSGQTVAAGSLWVHGFELRRARDVELGALLLSLALWRRECRTVGGMSSRGHGMLDMSMHVEPAVDQAKVITAYVDHIRARRKACVSWIEQNFGLATEAK